jgi:cyanophycin synthetase
MKILELKSIEGANEWSTIYDQLILMDLEITGSGLLDEKQGRMLVNDLETHLPSLIDYESGGLKKTPVSGTTGAFISLLVELVATELQTMAGTSAVFSDVSELAAPGVYRIVFSYEKKQAGLYAAAAAVNMVQALLQQSAVNMEEHLRELIVLLHTQGVEKAA